MSLDHHLGGAETRQRDASARARTARARVEVDGVGIAYEVFGTGDRTIVLAPAWAIVNSHFWKGQVPFLARRFRVVTWDAPGTGRSDRTEDPAHHGRGVRDAVAVLDATETERALLVGLSLGAAIALFAATLHPDRVAGVVALASTIPQLVRGHAWFEQSFEEDPGTDEGWDRYTRGSWHRDYPGFVEHFAREMLPEPHSEKLVDDIVGWGLDAGLGVLEATMDAAPGYRSREQAEQLVAGARCPVLVIHGDEDAISPLACGERVAELTGGELVVFEGSGHALNGRDPVRVNALIEDFAEHVLGVPPRPPRRWTRALARGKRALLVSSPIGLGHARRDLAIAHELRRLVPGLEIDWLAQHPLTAALEAAGERVHPASAGLASESAHLEALSGAHTLPVFQAIREMDEILVANYMIFRDVVRDTPYDVWIGDESWDVDHFLHENPEDKRAPFAFLTDFVGWLPLPGGRRARGVPVRRPQRPDDRAGRALPVRARPRAVRRRAGGRRAGRLRPRAAGDPRLGAAPLRVRRPDHRRGGAVRAQRRTGRCAWPRSAARRSAASCWPGSWRATRRRPSGCPGCGWSRSPARGSTRRRSRRPTASRSAATCRTSTACSPPATSRSSRAG